MSTIYNPESETIASIERLALEARNIRRRMEHVLQPHDKRVLDRQLGEIQKQIEYLRRSLP